MKKRVEVFWTTTRLVCFLVRLECAISALTFFRGFAWPLNSQTSS